MQAKGWDNWQRALLVASLQEMERTTHHSIKDCLAELGRMVHELRSKETEK